MQNIKILASEMGGYKLLDSGNREKLEEINGTKIVRAEPRAWWQRELESSEWQGASKELETTLDIGIGGVKAKIKYKPNSKHIGIFPEQFPQWQWIGERIKNYELRIKDKKQEENKKLKILNLFGYTGIASLVAAQAGLPREASAKWRAEVTHVDASKQAVDWARENQKLSGLENAKIRWIVDDAVKFLKREKNRLAQRSLDEVGGGYDAIIMDPPSYGKGPKGEVWKIEEQLPSLLAACRAVLSDEPLFVIFNMYSTELSSIAVANLLSDMMSGFDGNIESGELVIKQQNSERLLPLSISAMWSI